MDYVAGIDLGTTNTVCAVYIQGKSAPEVIPLTMQFNSFDVSGRTRALLMPSAVCLKDGKVYVGHIGRLGKQLGFGDYNFVSIKRYMGTHWVKTVKNEVWTPERVSACILATVKKELETKFESEDVFFSLDRDYSLGCLIV